ncbi:MAG: DHH family phosphoesterase [Candidatus Caldarchaeales archaeon]
MGEEEYFRLIEKVAEEIRGWSGSVGLVFHNDADGLCAAGISASALKKIELEHKLICIEKIHPAILKLVYSTGCGLYIFLDIGSGRVDLIAEMSNDTGSRAIILDHHDPIKVESQLVVNLNPELYGFSGERDVSGSTATYLLMRKLTDIQDSAWMAVVGSAEIPGMITGLNKIPLEDSVRVGSVEVRRDREESYIVKFFNKSWTKLSSTLTAIGSIGYYRRGPYRVIDYLLSRKIDFREAEEMEEERKNRFSKAFAILSRYKLKFDGMVQWFHINDLFNGLGTKTLGTFCSMLSYKKIISPNKYLVGFMNFEPELPSLGRVEGEWVKVSVRTPKDLGEDVKLGKMPPASELTMRSAEAVGGSGDGHSFAASALIPSGKEKEFIEIFNHLVAEKRNDIRANT